ncbi:response regulator transcription factor [Anaerolentibacter hominis]|uniref:response regulator transcription factor n=1 Tax=Anaerolentibacter hominis TaxID=3079009 RepID=UPI0031B80117
MYQVLMVDDDPDIIKVNKHFFENKGYRVFCAENAGQAREILAYTSLDCLILDVDLPDASGFELCREVRENTDLPILFLSAFTQEQSRIRGLLVGGDDYICKPYSLPELELRCRIRIRRRRGEEPAKIMKFPGLTIDLGQCIVTNGKEQARLTAVEFKILVFLAGHPGQVFSYAQLYDRIWNAPLGDNIHNMHVHMSRIRQRLDALCPSHSYICTVRGRGYQFVPPDCQGVPPDET